MALSSNPLSFSTPFEGRAVPIDVYALCLITPATFMKLLGVSMQSALTSLLSESFYKRWKYGPATEGLLRDFAVMMSAKAPEMPYTDLFVSAAAGDLTAREKLESISEYTAFLEGLGAPRDTLHNAHLLAVESAIQPIRKLASDKKYSEVTAVIRGDSLLRRFIPDELLDTLDKEPTQDRLALIKITSMLETHLSLLAASEVQTKLSGLLPLTNISVLLATKPINTHSPNALFFAWFKHVSNSPSLASMARKLELAGTTINSPSLKRWNTGKVLPDHDSIKVLTEVLMSKEDLESVNHMRFSAKMLNFLGHTAEVTRVRAEALIASGFKGSLGHWPRYPFECKNYVEWVNIRFRYWVEFHLEQESERNSLHPAAT